MNYYQLKNKYVKYYITPSKPLYYKLMIIEKLITINDKILLQLIRMKYTNTILYSCIDEITKVFDSLMKATIDLIS